jgi:hypothetical protein
MALFDSVYLIALAAWIGSFLFLSLGVVPLVSRLMGPPARETLVRALFPRYCLWGAICGALALPSMVAVPLCYPEYRGGMIGLRALAIIASILVVLYTGNLLGQSNIAAGNGARNPDAKPQFERLYRRALSLNGIAVAVALALLVAFATRPAPRTSGIVELAPIARSRYDAAIGRVIEQTEFKYGFRADPAFQPAGPAAPQPEVDPQTVEEIESFYARKRQRIEARTQGRAPAKDPRDTRILTPSSRPPS